MRPVNKNERFIFLNDFKSLPWQIIDKLQLCYDNGDEIIKMAAYDAAKGMEHYAKMMQILLDDSMARESREIKMKSIEDKQDATS